ncbi:hypothetical protein CCAX7_39320 [Capsulimonas corticalis]|uniref:Uncharacterized protein n=1 Tax=Capsulimonas corticalis TaxID=2219043 RepID=A0A402D3P6_9BACT|nr:hypothetical protein [Capsulimonas corticalis]BDI31881.1 hypothetical protein CCAX7_39320 [Capsulimonas corticalis]
MTKSLAPLIVFTALFICALAGGTYWSIRRPQIEDARRARQEVALTRAAGISLDRTLLKPVLPSAADNAGPIYQQISAERKFHRVDSMREDRLLKLARTPKSTPAEMAKREAFLRQNVSLLRLIHLAVAKPDCVVNTNWDAPNPQDVRFPEIASMREAARMIQNESLLMASEGRVAEAIQNQALGFRIADHCATVKRSSAYIIANAVNSITFEGMRNILEFHGDNPATANAVRLAIQRSAHTPDLSATLRAETIVGYSTIEYFRTASVKDFQTLANHYVITSQDVATLSLIRQNTNSWNAYLDFFETGLLQRDRADIASADLPLPLSYAQISQHAAAFEKRKEAATPMANVLDLDTANLASWRSQSVGMMDVLETSANILIWKSQHGAFPATLSAIGVTPLDPYSGKPFGYRREGAGFVLYSVGKDGTFDGGTPQVKPKDHSPIFRYPAPSYYLSTAPGQ